MALEGELDIYEKCPDCGIKLPIKVCMSGAGYYIGQYCGSCGPINRLSLNYFPTAESAQRELDSNEYFKRDTKYHRESTGDN
jgi:hypothetical protein